MIGIGAANLAAGLFQGFPVSTSASRTAVAERAGARSQLTGVTGAALIIVMIVFLPGLFRNLPQAALAAVVITASLSLADLPGTARLWQQRKVEFSLSIVAFLGVALLGVLPGIAIAVGLSILNVFRRAWRPYQTTLGLVDGLAGLPRRPLLPGRPAAPGPGDLPLRRAAVLRQRQDVPGRGHGARPQRARAPVDRVAAEPITDVDTTAADVLFDLDHLLDERGQTLVFAELKDPVRRKIERYGLAREIEPQHFFPTVEAAVDAFRARTGASWADGIADPAAATALPQPRPGQPGAASEQRGGTRPT